MNHQKQLNKVVYFQFFWILLVALGPWIEWVLKAAFFSRSVFFEGMGIFFITFGIILFSWSVWTMGKSFEIRVTPRQQARLIMTGPFAYSRNPIYVSAFFIGIGWSVATASWFSFVSTLILMRVLHWKIKIEEQQLSIKFGPSYSQYQNQVRRFF